jgi:hypothetical protein
MALRLDPLTGHARQVRTVAQDVVDMALSPDGTQLAYLTYPTCPPVFDGKLVAGPAISAPSVLEVLTLATGAIRSKAVPVDASGLTLYGLAWSPDGRALASTAIRGVGDNRVLMLDALGLDPTHAREVAAPPTCHYNAEAWPATGMIVAEMCGTTGDSSLAPTRLFQLDDAQAVTHSWPLPACTGGATSVTDRQTGTIVAQADIGYSGCDISDQSTRLLRISGSTVDVIIEIPGVNQVSLVG